jgi:GNAT superfamily N-acetyltransferase
MTPSIRPVGPYDLDALLKLYVHLNPADTHLPEVLAKARFREMLEHPGLTVFGVFADDRLVASCVLHVLPNLTRGGASYALIENVVADASERRQGHAGRVVRAATDAAFAAGCYKIMLLTGRTDSGVHRFYESCGFKQSKTGFEMRMA